MFSRDINRAILGKMTKENQKKKTINELTAKLTYVKGVSNSIEAFGFNGI